MIGSTTTDLLFYKKQLRPSFQWQQNIGNASSEFGILPDRRIPQCSVFGRRQHTMPTVSGLTYEWTTNGSGKPDYLVTFDGLDIFSSAYRDDDQIVGRFTLMGNESGFEELSIGGYRYGDTSIPEPSSVALFGLALAGLGFMR